MLDANILLNLYRYSESTKNDFLAILKNQDIRNRLWLPHRAAEEYLENRSSVISEQAKSYKSMIEDIKTFKSNLDNKRQHPFITENLKNNLDSVLDSLTEELDSGYYQHDSRHTSDPIKAELDELIGNNITGRYDDEVLKEIFTNGKDRYTEKTPPGYKDEKKDNSEKTFSNNCRVFGDLILWRQVIDFSVSSKSNIILVTDDKKEDWWQIESGKTLGPRPELIAEFESCTEKSILIYQADRFFEYSSRLFQQTVDPGSKEEISDLTKRRHKIESVKSRINEINTKRYEITEMINVRESALSELRDKKIKVFNELLHSKEYGDEKTIKILELKLKEVDYEMNNIYYDLNDLKHQLDANYDDLSIQKKRIINNKIFDDISFNSF